MTDYADLIERLRGTYPTRADRWADCEAAAAALEEAGKRLAESEALCMNHEGALARLESRIKELEGE